MQVVCSTGLEKLSLLKFCPESAPRYDRGSGFEHRVQHGRIGGERGGRNMSSGS